MTYKCTPIPKASATDGNDLWGSVENDLNTTAYRPELDFAFHADSTDVRSGLIHVDKNCVSLTAVGLLPGETIEIFNVVAGVESKFSPLPTLFFSFDLKDTFNNVFLSNVGAYRLVLSDASMLGRVVVSKEVQDCDYEMWLNAVAQVI